MGNETRKGGRNDRRCSSSFQGGMFLENCQEKVYRRKARRALCVRGLFRKVIGPGSRAMHISGRHSRMERSQGTISVSQDRSRDRLLTRIFFFKGARREEKKTRGVDAYPLGKKSILRRSTLPHPHFVFLSFFRHPPPRPSKTRLRTTRVCESLQLAARESISIRGKGIYSSFTNENFVSL